VRLKEEIGARAFYNSSLFQFLLVRLKESDSKPPCADRTAISIPFGAIKS